MQQLCLLALELLIGKHALLVELAQLFELLHPLGRQSACCGGLDGLGRPSLLSSCLLLLCLGVSVVLGRHGGPAL